MPNKQATTLDFPGSHLPKQDTVKGGGARAPSDRNPGSLHPTPGLERGVPPAYRGQGGLEGPGPPGGEEVPNTQTGPGTVDMSSPARVRSLDRPSPDGLLICHDETIPAHRVILNPSGSYFLPSSTSSSSSSSSFASSSFTSSSSSALELKSEETTGVVCLKGRVSVDKRSYNKEPFTIYGRNGPRTTLHLESRCTNPSCRVGYYEAEVLRALDQSPQV